MSDLQTVLSQVATADGPRISAKFIVISSTGQVRLIKRSQKQRKNCWECPGGGVDEGETIAAGAIRELFEETGLKISAADIFDAGIRRYYHDASERRVEQYFFLLQSDAEFKLAADEHSAAETFSLLEILGPNSPIKLTDGSYHALQEFQTRRGELLTLMQKS